MWFAPFSFGKPSAAFGRQACVTKGKKQTLRPSRKIVYFVQKVVWQALNFMSNTNICLKTAIKLRKTKLQVFGQ